MTTVGRNNLPVTASVNPEIADPTEQPSIVQLKLDLQQKLNDIKAQIQLQRAEAKRLQQQQIKAQLEASRTAMIERMRQYLLSGDRILVQEALTWMQANPELLSGVTLPTPYNSG